MSKSGSSPSSTEDVEGAETSRSAETTEDWPPTNDEINTIFEAMMQAKISDFVHREAAQLVKDKNWTWLEERVQQRLNFALKIKRRNEFVYLTAQEWLSWYISLSQAVVAIGTLGAGLVFSIIFSAPADLDSQQTAYVRTCLSASWLLFVMSLGVASFAALLFTVNKNRLLQELDKTQMKELLKRDPVEAGNQEELPNSDEGGIEWYQSWLLRGVVVTVLLVQLLPIGAFLAAAEGIRTYQPKLGIAAHVSISTLALILLGAWIGQNSIRFQQWIGLMGKDGLVQKLGRLLDKVGIH